MSAEEDYQKRMQRKKTYIDKRIAQANINKGVCVLLTGNGKGKTSSALGMVCRALGYGMKIGVVQFIKGTQTTGENLFLQNQPLVKLVSMQSGFTWDTQNKASDSKAAKKTWVEAEKMLTNNKLDLVVLDEITYMLSYAYLDEGAIINAITNRPSDQHLVLTGRNAPKSLYNIADTVSDIKDIKHAFRDNIAAQKGLDL